MSAVKFKAKAKTQGRCALHGCVMAGDKIYEGDGLRILACTQGHADAVMKRLAQPPKGMSKAEYMKLRDQALRVYNARPTPPTAQDDYDIPI